jgi:hypothetical protein
MNDAVERMRASKQAYDEQQRQNGHEAGVAFATNKADYEDLLILRAIAAYDHADDELLNLLYLNYVEHGDLCVEEFKEHLFADEDADPAEHFVGAFFRAALETLEDIARQAEHVS